MIDTIQEHCTKDEGPIHLIGDSAGGLDARLLTSPSVTLEVLSWIAFLGSLDDAFGVNIKPLDRSVQLGRKLGSVAGPISVSFEFS